VLSVAMLLEHLGESQAATAVETAVAQTLPKLGAMSGPGMGASTDEIGDRIAEAICVR
jgi:3-isopropylmalate dehydrogenase